MGDIGVLEDCSDRPAALCSQVIALEAAVTSAGHAQLNDRTSQGRRAMLTTLIRLEGVVHEEGSRGTNGWTIRSERGALEVGDLRLLEHRGNCFAALGANFVVLQAVETGASVSNS